MFTPLSDTGALMRPLLLLALAACQHKAPVSVTSAPETLSVTIPVKGLTLEGTLHLPARSGPVPGVILVHGSGPNSRDEPLAAQLNMGFGLTIEAFAGLATELADRGIAVLRYDKRTCTTAVGCNNAYPAPSPDILVDDFIADAVAAADWLASRDEVGSVGVIGHSQGGTLVPIVVRDSEARVGVSLAGPMSTIDVLLQFQADSSERLLQAAGMEPQAILPVLAPLREMADGVEAVRLGSSTAETVAGVPTAFWRNWIDVSARAEEALRTSPSLGMTAIFGGYDWNVPASEADVWRPALEAHPGPTNIVVLDCITHALNCVSQPDYEAITPADIGSSVHTSVVDAIAEALLPLR